MKWDDKTGVKLRVDIARKAQLPDERFVDSGLTRNLPAKHLQRILADNRPRVTDGLTAHIPNTPAPHRRVKQTDVFFAGEDKAKRSTDQFQASDRTALHQFLHLERLRMMPIHERFRDDASVFVRGGVDGIHFSHAQS